MPIRWSALKVSEAADRIEEFAKEAAEPLEQARIVAREALKLPNLPQYIEWDFNRIIGEIDRAIGGSQSEPIGRIRAGVEGIRKDLPEGSVEEERDSARHGATPSLI
jgi:hypothetical protein